MTDQNMENEDNQGYGYADEDFNDTTTDDDM